jgi:hypothetical protein
MVAAGLDSFTPQHPQSCQGSLFILSAYSFRSHRTNEIEVMMSSVGTLDFNTFTAVYVDLHTGSFVRARNCSYSFQLTHCFFFGESGSKSVAKPPTVLYFLHKESVNNFGVDISKHSLSQEKIRKGSICAVSLQPIIRPAQPQLYLLGVTEVRDAVNRLEDWMLYNFRVGYDHMVIYDDCSTDDLIGLLKPYIENGLVTYINWTMQARVNELTDEHRQFTALTDFQIRFSMASKIVSQLDDDCFFYAVPKKVGDDIGSLRMHVQYQLDHNPNAGQLLIIGHWFGACFAAASDTKPFILQESMNNESPVIWSEWRHKTTWSVR